VGSDAAGGVGDAPMTWTIFIEEIGKKADALGIAVAGLIIAVLTYFAGVRECEGD